MHVSYQIVIKLIDFLESTNLDKFLGIIINIFWVLNLLSIVLYGSRTVVDLIKTTVLPLTPESVVYAVFIIPSLYAAYQGIEYITRANWLLTPFILLTIIIIMVGLYPFMDVNYLTPILGTGFKPILITGFLSALFLEIRYVGILAPFIRDFKKIFKVGIWALVISAILMAAIVEVTYLVFGEGAAIITFPFYQLASAIYFGRFIQRIEAVFIIIWVFITVIEITILFYTSALSLAQTLKLPNYRPLLFPISLLVLTIGLLPKSMPVVIQYISIANVMTTISTIVLPFIIFLVALVRKRVS